MKGDRQRCIQSFASELFQPTAIEIHHDEPGIGNASRITLLEVIRELRALVLENRQLV